VLFLTTAQSFYTFWPPVAAIIREL